MFGYRFLDFKKISTFFLTCSLNYLKIAAVGIGIIGFSWATDVELIASINKKKVLVGEKITLRLTLRTPQDQSSQATYRLPILKGKLGNFSIKDYRLIKSPAQSLSDNSEWVSQTIAYILVGYVVGKQAIPAIQLNYGEKTVTTTPLPIEVESVLVGVEPILEPIKPNQDIKGSLSVWVYLTVILSVVVAGYLLKLLIAVLWSRRNLPYYDMAWIQIKKLDQEVSNHHFSRRQYIKLDRIVRSFYAEYIGNPDILSMTSRQIQHIPRKQLTKGRNFFDDFFSITDSIKFQAIEPNPGFCCEQMAQFLRVIKEVKQEEKEKTTTKKKLKTSLRTSDGVL